MYSTCIFYEYLSHKPSAFISEGNDDVPIDPWNFRFKYFCNVTSLSTRRQACRVTSSLPYIPGRLTPGMTLYADEGVRLMKGLCV